MSEYTFFPGHSRVKSFISFVKPNTQSQLYVILLASPCIAGAKAILVTSKSYLISVNDVKGTPVT